MFRTVCLPIVRCIFTVHSAMLYVYRFVDSFLAGPGWNCTISRMVPRSIPGGVTGDFFRGTPDRTMCPEVDSASEIEYQGFLLG